MTSPALKLPATLLAVCALPVSAALLPADHPAFGPGSLTRDTAQNLYWLTPGVTAGLSFVETQTLLANDVRFTGFRVATSFELEVLYSEAVIPDINVPGFGALYGTEANVFGVQLLQSLTGIT